jgi:hypothetical protein
MYPEVNMAELRGGERTGVEMFFQAGLFELTESTNHATASSEEQTVIYLLQPINCLIIFLFFGKM